MAISGIPHPILIPALTALAAPLAAFALIMIQLRQRARLAAGVSIAAVSLSFGCAVWLLAANRHMTAPLEHTWQWMVSGDLTITAGLLLDPLSLLMAVVVATICLLVQIYSLGYMAGDPGMGRYYGFMSLFAWAMLSMTLSVTLLQLYIFWELVGLASYLLIGFWFEKFSASQAGKKAFVMTRLGDVAFLLGILLVLGHLGNLDILALNTPEVAARFAPAWLTLAVLLIFGGVIGKSAQFPLLTWLPDAMEGPTPVSALLHSATMVAAGVYLFARLFPFFSLSPTAMTVCLAVGTISMLLSSTMAMVARDIKQVWAYSTISQLGFMIMGLAAGSYFAGVFHLTTHAGFKALLFLCSGVLIHHFGTNDMFAISRAGGRRLKITIICMTLAAGALSGLPPLSGFFSKEAIMGALAARSNPIWLGAGLLGAFLTAYYSFRLIFVLLFAGRDAAEEGGLEADHHTGHDTAPAWHDRVMNGPLLILAAVTLVLGFMEHPLERFLSSVYPEGAPVVHHLAWLPWTAIGLCLAGLLLAWVEFGRPRAPRIGFVERVPALHNLFAERWYIDRFYRWFLDLVIYRFVAGTCEANDRKVIDGGLDGLGQGVQGSGRKVDGLNRVVIQQRLGVMFAVIFFLALYVFF